MRKKKIDNETMIAVAAKFKALGEPSRLRIVEALKVGENGVNQLVELTNLTQSNVSQHLKVLGAAGLVAKRREGTSVVYSLSDPTLIKVCDLVCGSITHRLC